MLFLNLHFHGLVVDEIFFGLWLVPLALLVYRARFLPRFLGVWLAIDGFAWVILSLSRHDTHHLRTWRFRHRGHANDDEVLGGLSANRNLHRSCPRTAVRKQSLHVLPSYSCQE
jgi:hypothetical protein